MLEKEESFVELRSFVTLDEDGAGTTKVVGFEFEDSFLKATEEAYVTGTGNQMGVIAKRGIAKEEVFFGLRLGSRVSLVCRIAACSLV